jgi:site-specific DNA recombinase
MDDKLERLRVALYARVSSEEQKQGNTIASQIAELRQFATQRGWTVVDVYVDEAWSGAALARPALDRLRDDARAKRFDAVLINDVDRLARDVTHLGIIKRDLERSGVRVIFRKIPSENGPAHNLLVNVLGSFAEFEREMILDRTRRGRRHKVETRQQFIGAIAPYGYRYLPATPSNASGTLTVNTEEALVVRTIFKWVDEEGLSARDVGVRLTKEGFRPRKGGPDWQRSSVLRILRGTIYIGTWYYNKNQLSYRRAALLGSEPHGKKTSLRLRRREEWIPVALPDEFKIISPGQWHRVQEQLDRNRCFSRRNAKHEYLLSGLVECGACENSFCGNPSHGRFYYRCLKRCKRVPQITENVLNNSVWSALQKALDNPKLLVQAIQGTERRTSSTIDTDKSFETALQGIKDEEFRILEAYRLSIITPEMLAHELESLKSRRHALETQRTDAAQSKEPGLSIRRSVDDYCNIIHRKLEHLTFETKRNVLRLLVRRIVFDGKEVRILGVIPLMDSGGIAPTGIDPLERNPAMVATFKVCGPILRNLEAARAASRANLARANDALRLRRDRQHGTP